MNTARVTDLEPILNADQIQGNVVPGFLKPHMTVAVLTVVHADAARMWIGSLADELTTLGQAMPSRHRIRAARHGIRPPRDAGLAAAVGRRAKAGKLEVDDVWVNVSFSYDGLTALIGDDPARQTELEQFEDVAFRLGLPARSPALGDPTGVAAGSPSTWLVGGPANDPVHVLVVVAGDRPEAVHERVEALLAAAGASGLTVAYREDAHKRDRQGREHFGFKDGVSQPGVRGRYAPDADAFVTPRTISRNVQPEADLYGLPGQTLVWPGEFVFGYPASSPDPLLAGLENRPGPAWSRDGSYLVFRRLAQNVDGFQAFVESEAEQLRGQPDWPGWTAERVAAAIIGRWPSGAPLSRSPDGDDEKLGGDRFANNNFNFALTPPAYELVDGAADTFPHAASDPVGLGCPLSAHIRKVNTRAAANDRGAARTTLSRRILRRGLPYGRDDDVDKGLLFLSYQASISAQFEFLVTSWMNDPAAPRSPSGQDLLVGQNGQPGQGRERSAVFLNKAGGAATFVSPAQFITPTGGGYFFTPSVSAVRDVIGTSLEKKSQGGSAVTLFRPLDGVAHPSKKAGDIYRERRAAAGGAADQSLNMSFYGGKTVTAMTFVNLYVGGGGAWNQSERTLIDGAMSAAMSDAGLNNVMAQYFGGEAPTTRMLPSVVLPDAASKQIDKDTVEGWVIQMQQDGKLPASDLATTCYCFLLPPGIVLSDDSASGRQSRLPGEHDAADSKNGLGGYHGSVHVGSDTVYYAVGVYSDSNNGIDAFGAADWKNVVATFYHELNEFRTDADVSDAARTGDTSYLAWYSTAPEGGEVGDIPINQSGGNLSTVFKEVALSDGSGTVPVQLMWSNDSGSPGEPAPDPLSASPNKP